MILSLVTNFGDHTLLLKNWLKHSNIESSLRLVLCEDLCDRVVIFYFQFKIIRGRLAWHLLLCKIIRDDLAL